MPREDGSYAPEEVEQIKSGLQAALDEANKAAAAATAGRQAVADQLEAARAEKDGLARQLDASKSASQAVAADVVAMKTALRDAAAKHRALLLQANPAIPEELVAGDDIPGLEASMARARAVVEKVRARLTADSQQLAANHHVPPGAPPRSAPDVESLSPTEKIKHALRGR